MIWLEREEKGWGRREQFAAWHLLRSPLLQVRIHRMCEPDRPEFYHSHPRHFLSIILWGRYLEEREGMAPSWRWAGSIAWRSRNGFHAAWHPRGKASWSLVFFFGRKESWFKAEFKP